MSVINPARLIELSTFDAFGILTDAGLAIRAAVTGLTVTSGFANA